jgi:propionyl-CoA carboxylase beta chain
MGGMNQPLLFIAAEHGYIDDVIMLHATRPRVARALAMLRGKTVEDAGPEAR